MNRPGPPSVARYTASRAGAKAALSQRKAFQPVQEIEQLSQFILAEFVLQALGQGVAGSGVVKNDLAPLVGDFDDRFPSILLVLGARNEPVAFHGFQDPCQAGQQQAGISRNRRLLLRPVFVKHSQDAPLLFRDTGAGEHLAHGFHDNLAGAQQSDRKRPRGLAKGRGIIRLHS